MHVLISAIGASAGLVLQRSDSEATMAALEEQMHDETLVLGKNMESDFEELQRAAGNPESYFSTRRLAFLEVEPAKTTVVPAKTEKALKKAKSSTSVTIAVAPEASPADKEAKAMEDVIKNVKATPVEQMPMLLALMKDMYNRFKKNIARANELEQKSKDTYKKNLEEKAKWPKSYLQDKAMMNLANHWDKARELSHRHYHNMLKLSHAGMARLKTTMDMMEKAIAGKKLNEAEMQKLKEMAPEVVFVQIQDLAKFCGESLVQLQASVKKYSSLNYKFVRQLAQHATSNSYFPFFL